MRKYTGFLFGILLSCLLVFSLHAAAPLTGEPVRDRLQDQANLLNAREKAEILQMLNEISEKYSCDVVVITLDALGSEDEDVLQDRADSYLDYNDFGFGAHRDSILLLRTQEERFWAISTMGKAIRAFNSQGQEYVMEAVIPCLREDRYADAFRQFAQRCDELLELDAQGTPYRGEPMSLAAKIGISLAVGMLVALIVTLILRGQLRSVAPACAANQYVRKGSMNLTHSRDIFLYHTVSRRERPKNTGGSGGTHVSSGGYTHGGSHGRA